MGSGQELRVPVICNKGIAEVSRQWLAWLQEPDLGRETLSSSLVDKDNTGVGLFVRTLFWPDTPRKTLKSL